jgi:TolA-binding protein
MTSTQYDKALFRLGCALFGNGSFKEARDVFARLLNDVPKSPFAIDTYALLGDVMYRQASFSSAAKLYERAATSTHPAVRAYAFYRRGVIAVEQNDPSNAKLLFNNALAQDAVPVALTSRVRAAIQAASVAP